MMAFVFKTHVSFSDGIDNITQIVDLVKVLEIKRQNKENGG